MKSKIKRSLLSVFLLVFLCTGLTACTQRTDVSNVNATFDDRTITVSCPEDNTFILNIQIKTNSATTSWTSENLRITGGVPHNYDIESLVGDYVSESAKINAVNVQSASVTDNALISFIVFVIGIILGFIISAGALVK